MRKTERQRQTNRQTERDGKREGDNDRDRDRREKKEGRVKRVRGNNPGSRDTKGCSVILISWYPFRWYIFSSKRFEEPNNGTSTNSRFRCDIASASLSSNRVLNVNCAVVALYANISGAIYLFCSRIRRRSGRTKERMARMLRRMTRWGYIVLLCPSYWCDSIHYESTSVIISFSYYRFSFLYLYMSCIQFVKVIKYWRCVISLEKRFYLTVILWKWSSIHLRHCATWNVFLFKVMYMCVF